MREEPATGSPRSPTRQLWTWTALNLTVWPLGLVLAGLAGAGQDPAGAGMYGGLTLFGTVLLAGLPISMRLVRLLQGAGSRASGWARGAAILSIVLVLIVALPFLALLFLEGYWMLALAALVVLYFGFFGVGSLRRRRP